MRSALLTASVVALQFAGCSILAPPDARLCAAAQNLSSAMAMTATAIEADQAGEIARAQGLATEARSVAELGYSRLRSMPEQDTEGPVWQALQLVYLGTAQAANSLLPAYVGTHGVGPDALASAALSIDKAREGLPAMCFAIPADLETSGPR